MSSSTTVRRPAAAAAAGVLPSEFGDALAVASLALARLHRVNRLTPLASGDAGLGAAEGGCRMSAGRDTPAGRVSAAVSGFGALKSESSHPSLGSPRPVGDTLSGG